MNPFPPRIAARCCFMPAPRSATALSKASIYGNIASMHEPTGLAHKPEPAPTLPVGHSPHPSLPRLRGRVRKRAGRGLVIQARRTPSPAGGGGLGWGLDDRRDRHARI